MTTTETAVDAILSEYGIDPSDLGRDGSVYSELVRDLAALVGGI